jgi:hypothetical protein
MFCESEDIFQQPLAKPPVDQGKRTHMPDLSRLFVHKAFPLPRSLRADQMRTKDTEQKTTTLKVKELFVSFSRSAKPLYVGSNPTRASKPFHKSYLG